MLKTDRTKAEKILILTWDKLNTEIRNKYKNIIFNILKRHCLYSKPPDLKTSRLTSQKYQYNSDDIDIEGTVEGLLTKPLESYEDIFVWEKEKKHPYYVIMLDNSGSMQGSKLIYGALLILAVASILDSEYISVIVFSEEKTVTKRFHDQINAGKMAAKLLELKAKGCTNIYLALETGLKEFNSMTTQRKGILLTDGWQNTGGNPERLASEFNLLHVLELPGGSSIMCNRLAASGKGNCVQVSDFSDIIRGINSFLY